VGESEYWKCLQFRVNRGVAGSPQSLSGWCDWFEPKTYVLDGPSPRIMGRMGFVSGRGAAEYTFTLFLKYAVGPLNEIDWAPLLPPDGTTGWLSFDSGLIEIEVLLDSPTNRDRR
jgi:hypothetical protein